MNISDPLDPLLPTVTNPARYTGGEWNPVHKDWDAARVRLALAYPDLYELGMSNLGLLILYDIANRLDDVLCERAYAPWTDMEAAMRAANLPLFTVESRRPLADFDIVGFTLPHELNYTNVLNMLDLAGIPLLARERADAHPIILGGGTGSYNPEPLADFFDLLAVGEGEEVLVDLLACYRQLGVARGGPGRRGAFLTAAAARIPGVYVPEFYQAEYHADGTVRRVVPVHPNAPARVTKRIVDPCRRPSPAPSSPSWRPPTTAR